MALGGESRLLFDKTNIFLYPAAAFDTPHFSVDIFDDWAGAVYTTEHHLFGFFLNRPTPQLERLNRYLDGIGGRALRQLDARPWADLLYGIRLNSDLRVAVAGRVEYDRQEDGLTNTSTSTSDIRVGLRFRDVDATVGILRRRFDETQKATSATANQTDGNGFVLDLRGRWALADAIELVPHFAYEADPFALSPDKRDFSRLQAGFGLIISPGDEVLLLCGLLTEYEQIELSPLGGPTRESSVLVLPATIIAGEVMVGSMLFRLGLRHESRLISEQTLADTGEIVDHESFRSSIETNFGLGLQFGDLMLDGLLERDFLRDGPHLVGGSRHGGGIFSKIGLTYKFR